MPVHVVTNLFAAKPPKKKQKTEKATNAKKTKAETGSVKTEEKEGKPAKQEDVSAPEAAGAKEEKSGDEKEDNPDEQDADEKEGGESDANDEDLAQKLQEEEQTGRRVLRSSRAVQPKKKRGKLGFCLLPSR